MTYPGIMMLALLSVLFYAYTEAQYCVPTQEAAEGPYWLPNAPNKQSILCDDATFAVERLLISGRVHDSDCFTGLPAQLDIWQANAVGVYSTVQTGMFCRSKIMTNSSGHYQFTTIFPGRYGFPTRSGTVDGYRPAHVHMKVTPLVPQYTTMTLQTYFKNDMFLGRNDSCPPRDCHSDSPTLIVEVTHRSDIKTYVGTFDIIMQKGFKYCDHCT